MFSRAAWNFAERSLSSNLAASLLALGFAAVSAGIADTSSHAMLAAQTGAAPELLIIDMDGNGVCLSSLERGVVFRFNPKDEPVRTAWTCAGNADAFVVMDITTNGRIDGGWEMLGGRPGPWPSNGISQLLFLDGWSPKEKGPSSTLPDGRLDSGDLIYPQLALWVDQNHDGLSQEKELESAAFGGVISISLNDKVVNQVDAFGNSTTRRATASIKRGPSTLERQVVTVKFRRSAG